MNNILLIGSGGREHAFAWKLAQSKHCSNLYIAPGNAGTAACGQNVPLNPLDFPAIERFVLEHQINMVVVGPEEPLVRALPDDAAAGHQTEYPPSTGITAPVT